MSEENDRHAVTQAVEGIASMYEALAIIGALAERQLIDPMRVAHWARFFGSGQLQGDLPEVKTAIAERLEQFASLIEAMAQKPAGAGRA